MTEIKFRCPTCDSAHFDSVKSSATDSEILECESCKSVYEIKYGPDGAARLVSV